MDGAGHKHPTRVSHVIATLGRMLICGYKA